MKPIKVDDITHQALKEYSVFLKRDMGDVIQDALLKNKAYKTFYDKVETRK